ncbi:MAG: hypothetical protein KF871_15290 [Hydrogenophaga sp.]|uniref:hypothetical protein n=1 Tax=Hydrogenophaga sp. TaxID=1904254 RepID=UPI001D91B52A|nr:hypothetical protein [Hydrogenophaga sp.]MBX3611255.1 hypothetical protein [Hydrogenophaga sp.]
MRTTRRANVLLMTATAAAVVLSAGCASTPPVAERMVPDPMGTVTTFHRKSSGSLGIFDGKVTWTHAPASWQGKPMIAFGAPQAGVSLHDPVTFDVVAYQRPDGSPLAAFNPPMGYRWPLELGKTWTSTHEVTNFVTGAKRTLTIQWKVVAYEDVTVPAGTFKAWKLQWTDNLGEAETRWAAPADGLATIKRHVERPASHPQGAGVLDAELLSRVRPAK